MRRIFLLFLLVLAGCGHREMPLADSELGSIYPNDILPYISSGIKSYPEFEKQVFREIHNAILIQSEATITAEHPSVSVPLEAWENSQYVDAYLTTHVLDSLMQDSILYAIYNKLGKQVGMDHILITFKGAQSSRSERPKAAAKALADSLYELITQHKLDFKTAVRRYSEEPIIRSRKGDMGYLDYGIMDPKVTEVAWAPRCPRYPPPIESSFGYHLVRVKGSRIIPLPSFTAMKPKIRGMIKSGNLPETKRAYEALERRLRRRYQLIFNDMVIDSLFDLLRERHLKAETFRFRFMDEDLFSLPVFTLEGETYTLGQFISLSQAIDERILDANLTFRYSLHRTLEEAVYRYLAARSAREEKLLDTEHFRQEKGKKEREFLVQAILRDRIHKEEGSTRNVLINRLALKYKLNIHEENIRSLFAQLQRKDPIQKGF